ncbi:hypothetical protein M9H77_15375 [Catharanthus roseus]|uniref:Uncharacterized protein n=1 Tax=Catharanthus roseus TaxID=4058 RepID=A0ACC0AZX3_CATRO|nr:hypothetical protein M9H77_15375 [Catharanthus roseus]
MGIVRTDERQRMEIEEFRRMLMSCAGLNRRKDDDGDMREKFTAIEEIEDPLEKLVCVTSGVSFLGIAIVNQLLVHGYSVRVIVDNQEDVERLREMQASGEMRGSNNIVEVTMAKLTEVESLMEAFNGCRGVFHTAAFVDPAGVSGYSKTMVEIEVKASKSVVEACAATPSVRHCVLTSSLLSCLWFDRSQSNTSRIIDHMCWSDEALCLNKKLWYALGKLRAEKAAVELAKERGLKLATICPGLITGPDFCCRNSTSTIAYLKGAEEMYKDGVLACVDVNTLARAHLCVLEEMNKTGNGTGRYICYDQIIQNQYEIRDLARKTGRDFNINSTEFSISFSPTRFELSNIKLTKLMSRTFRRCTQ